MKNKEKVLNMIDTARIVNRESVNDVVVGDCGDTTYGWLRCQSEIMEALLTEIRNVIDRQEVEF